MWTLDEIVEKLLPKIGELLKDNLRVTINLADDKYVGRRVFDVATADLVVVRAENDRLRQEVSAKDEEIRRLETSLFETTDERDSYLKMRDEAQRAEQEWRKKWFDASRHNHDQAERIRVLKENPAGLSATRIQRLQRIVDHVLTYGTVGSEWARSVLRGEKD